MNYTFIEIGTSNFHTFIQTASDKTPGISVEPITEYLDQLPDKPNVKKIAAAVAWEDNLKETTIYFIPEKDIDENGFESYLKGCNSVEAPHPAHNWANALHLVEKRKVPVITLEQIFVENQVEKVGELKLDTEGKDADILLHFAPFLATRKYKPIKISFECNYLTPKEKVDKAIEEYKKMGYLLKQRDTERVQLEYPI